MNHLELTNETLVKKIDTKEVSGFFSTKIEVPSGTKTLVFENGRNCGELTPGPYTLETFMGKLFLTSKNQVLFSCRDTNFRIDYSTSCLTKECLRVNVNLQISYSIDNTTLFVQNLMGSRDLYTEADFRTDTDPLILAAIQETIAQYSIKEFGTTESRQFLVTSLENAVLNSLSRYGIRFKDALLSSVSHERFDAIKEQKEELWLVKEGNEISKEEREAKLAARFDEITDQEKLNDLEILEKQVRNDRNEGELAVAKRRLEYNKNLRKVVQANEFDKLATQSEMEQFLFEQDKTGILREEEKKELLQGIDWAQEEKEIRRQQFLKKLDIQFQHELEDYQILLLHQKKLATLEQEMELARKVESEDNRKWLAQLDKEKTERKARQDELTDEDVIVRKKAEILIHQEQVESRLAELRRERENAEAAANLDRQKQMDQWSLELQNGTFKNQLEKIEGIRRIKEQKERFKMEMYKQKLTFEAEIQAAKEASDRAFKLDVIQSLKGMDYQTVQLVVLSTITKPEMQNSIIKALEIYSNTVAAQTQSQTEIAKAQAEAEVAKAQALAQNDASKAALDVQTKANDQLKDMMKQVMEMQERNADRMVQMNSQSVTAMGNMNNAPVVVTPGFPPVQAGTNPQGPAQEEKKVLLCPQCRAEVSANQKYCPNCGKQL